MFDDLMLSFQNIVNTNELVDFSNTYFGVPINNKGRMIRMSDGRGYFVVPRAQILAMLHNHFTHITSSQLPAILKAKVENVDWLASVVELDKFEYTDNSIGQRSGIRVKPSEPVQVLVMPEGGQKKSMLKISEIVELSLYGLAFLVDRAYFKASSFGIGKKVFVKFYLPANSDQEQETVISYEGVVKNVVIGQKCRIGMQVFPDSPSKLALSRYISHRREQILEQIESFCKKDSL